MSTAIRKTARHRAQDNIVLLCNKGASLKNYGLSKAELDYVEAELKKDKRTAAVNQYHRWVFVQVIEKKNPPWLTFEQCRKDGHALLQTINYLKLPEITIADVNREEEPTLCFAEGMALGNHQFLKYFLDAGKRSNALKTINIESDAATERTVNLLQIVTAATCRARDLVNEPNSYLTATQLSKELQKMAREAGFKAEVFSKTRIEALKMGGLLAVNKGSLEPPTFNILEWKPKNARNKKPYVLVGKGVVFDTGGLSLKPTPGSMDQMKCDMAGAAAVAGSIYAAAKAKLPLHVVGLIPATDNRPDGNAYVPGDVVKMFNGLSVEVLNTDAEGRMILADALAYAQRYKPELVIDLATLTGAAARAVGPIAIASMSTADEKVHLRLKESGFRTCERLVELPLWEEYGELIHSDIADIKNIGGANSGAITAGKFLEHFTKTNGKHAYPWVHLDIAGPAFLEKGDSYRGKNGTGVGVRLLFDFLQNTN